MTLWFATILGLVQGLTEFLPISSTAHLRIVPLLFGQNDPGAAFSAVIQLGTLLAVIVYFAKDLFVEIPKAMVKDPSSPMGKLPWFLVVGSIPVAVAGFAGRSFIEGDARSIYVVAAALIFVGGLFFVVEKVGAKNRSMGEITLKDVLIIGLAQACALIPGVSRSGSTIAAALFLGVRRSDAARFSFLLGIPAIGGAGIFELKAALDEFGDNSALPLLVGALAAFASGYVAIRWLLRFLSSNSLVSFGLYRIAVGLMLLVAAAANFI